MANVAKFWDNNNSDQRVKRWKGKRWWQDKAPGEDIENFIAEISKKRFSKSEEPDKLRWGYSNTGNFNPKEALGLLTETIHISPEAKWIKIWKGGWWPKILVFFWLVIKHRILTWDNLQVRGFHRPSCCPMCEEKNESINHLLDECRIANSLWEKGTPIFRRDNRHRGRPDITIAEWPLNRFKSKIVN